MVDPIKITPIEEVPPEEFNEMADLITDFSNALNRHTATNACIILVTCMSKILIDLSEAPNFDEFADFLLDDLQKVVNQVKENDYH